MTQRDRLLKWMQQRPIDPLTAWKMLGIYRLSARINELRKEVQKDGFEIVRKEKVVNNRFGEKSRVALYRLQRLQD